MRFAGLGSPSRDSPDVAVDLAPFGAKHFPAARGGQNGEFQSERADTAMLAKLDQEGAKRRAVRKASLCP